MTIGIVGVGSIGQAIASNLVAGGERVRLAARNHDAVRALADQLGELAEPGTVEEVLAAADTIVLPLPFAALEQFIVENRDALAGKVVIDTSHAIAPDENGNLAPILPEGDSAAKHVSSWLPETAHYAKAFSTLYANFLSENGRKDPRIALFFAAEHPEAIAATEAVIRAAGYDPVHAGGIDAAIRLEAANGGGDLHQFVGLEGRLITAEEARSLV